jgi:hypothetical protein
MGNVVISGNIKRTSERIDPSGNVINPRTRQIIKPVEPEYIPPAQPIPENLIPSFQEVKTSKIDEMINNLVEKKVAEIVTRKVEEALKNL